MIAHIASTLWLQPRRRLPAIPARGWLLGAQVAGEADAGDDVVGADVAFTAGVTTVGTSVPASGHLKQVYVTEDAAFFLASTGTVWPLPYPRVVRGLEDLLQTISRLMVDAGADVDEPAAAVKAKSHVMEHVSDDGRCR